MDSPSTGDSRPTVEEEEAGYSADLCSRVSSWLVTAWT